MMLKGHLEWKMYVPNIPVSASSHSNFLRRNWVMFGISIFTQERKLSLIESLMIEALYGSKVILELMAPLLNCEYCVIGFQALVQQEHCTSTERRSLQKRKTKPKKGGIYLSVQRQAFCYEVERQKDISPHKHNS